METKKAVLVTIVAERLLRDRLTEKIRALGAKGFTLTEVQGEGARGWQAHEFQGPSVKIETLVREEVAEKIVEAVSKYFEHHAVIVYLSDARVVRVTRF
ncbi:MAG TPA: P-II family nitrogen regulator [Longimicrobiales bacterium]|nr:P-II family nitrogen regulator [Longimicrobiales bacterium]